MAKKIWLVTGASRGFGRIWTEAALTRGDRVAATARDLKTLDALVERYADAVLPLALDITDADAVNQAVAAAHQHFGRLDVIVTNAGYGLTGALEETTVEEARANFETNVIGTFSTIKSVLPFLREQGYGHILSVSSIGGLVPYAPLYSVYAGSKFAIEGMVQSLAQEVAGFGIKITLIEPGPFATDFYNSSLKTATPRKSYDPVREQLAKMFTPDMLGDPKATADAILKVVDAEKPPLHFMLGPVLPMVKQVYADRVRSWEEWEQVSRAAQG